MVKVTSSERFIAGSPIGERIKDVFENNLAEGVLRLVTINGEVQPLRKLGNNEAKVAEVLESGYFGILHTNPNFIKAEIEKLIINKENIPDAYFKLQQRIARERGYGDIEFSEAVKDEAVATLQGDQVESLAEWADYLRSEENGHTYPDWFKVYVWESLKRMGDFDKQRGEFKKRTSSTTAPWPELNAEALAYVYDAIDTGVFQGVASDSDQLNRLLETGNFAKLYAYAITEFGVGGSPELREITKGSWVKYDQIEGKYTPDYTGVDGEYTDDKFVDNPTVIALTDSLRGMGTGWCTAGTRTAAHQLSMGDFYVYYTRDEEGGDTIPRVAIRMENGIVAEVRGIEPSQNLEGDMVDIVAEKLAMLPGGDTYFKKVNNMKRLTEIDERVKAGGELMADDIIFLRFSGRIEGFGRNADPRIRELLRDRSLDDDLRIAVQGCANPTKFANELIDQGYYRACAVAENIKTFAAAGANPTEIANRLISTNDDYVVVRNINTFLAAGANPTEIAIALIRRNYEYIYEVAHNLKAFLAAGVNPTEFAIALISADYTNLVAENIKTFAAAGANPTEIANRLMDKHHAYHVTDNIKTFAAAGVNPTEIANRLISADYTNLVADDLKPFLAAGAEIDPTRLADELIGTGKGCSIVFNLSAFIDAGAEIDLTKLVDELIDSGSGGIIADNLKALLAAGAEIDLTKLARSLVDYYDGYSIAYNPAIFAAAIDGIGIDLARLAGALIYADHPDLVIDNLNTFLAAGVNPTDLANELISADYYAELVADNLNTFLAAGAEIDPTKFANELIDQGYYSACAVARNIKAFADAGVNPAEIASRLISANYSHVVVRNIKAFAVVGVDRSHIEEMLKLRVGI